MPKSIERDSPSNEWDQFYVNVGMMDEQHMELLDAVNTLHDLMLSNHDFDEVDRAFSELVKRTRVHFRTEEKLMREYDFPDYQEHKQMHAHLLAQVKDMQSAQQAVAAHGVHQSWYAKLELIEFLQLWLRRHICDEDKKLGAFLNSKGVE